MTDQISPASQPPVRRSFGPGRGNVAPLLALVGLLVAGLLTAGIYSNWTPTLPGQEETPSITPTPVESGPTPTPAPTETIATNPEIAVPGMLVYAKSGSLWVQSGTTARQITEPVNGSKASQPAFSGDGQWIYYIDTRTTTGRWYNPDNGNVISNYTLNYPTLCRVHPDGSARADVLTGLIKRGQLKTFYWIRQPSVLPSGGYVAVVSDGPTGPGLQDTVIHYVTLRTGKLGAALALRETPPLGLSDPKFSPDGRYLAYTMEGRSGKYGAPSIWIYTGRTNSARRLAAGYRAASWSPDGKYLAATKVNGDALDVVILDASSGKQVGQVTSDGASWAPVWSPSGDKLVYMRMTNTTVELNMVYITASGSNFTFKIEPNLTDFSGLDWQSPAAWFIPGYGPAPAATATPGASDSAVPSSSTLGSPTPPPASAAPS